jgi:hypothetical protein
MAEVVLSNWPAHPNFSGVNPTAMAVEHGIAKFPQLSA